MKDTKFLMSLLTLIFLAGIGFLFWYVPRNSLHSIKATSLCNDIYKEKAPGYFNEEGTSRYIFNSKKNSCLLLNTISEVGTGNVRYVVVDMIKDTIVFYYDLKKDEFRDQTLHLTKDEALDRIRALGFVIF